jgi:hypothetical protein
LAILELEKTLELTYKKTKNTKKQKNKTDQMSDSVGFPRPIKTSKKCNSKTTSVKKISSPKAARASSSHSYQITIKELMNTLPWHSQNTAAQFNCGLCCLMFYIRDAGTAVEEHMTYSLAVISVL